MRISIIIVSILVLNFCVYAGNDPASDTIKTYHLDPITVTATRTQVARSIVAPSISVIPNEILVESPQKSILSIVSQEVPGVFVQERGILGYGVTTSTAGQISIRGVGGNPNTQVLMMIDGRPQYTGLFGHPLTDSYVSADAERVEIIRGPASVLYGTNAMGGVINIITHTMQKTGVSGDIVLSYGTFDSQHLGGKIGYNNNGWNAIASFTREHTDGHRPQSEFNSNSGYIKIARVVNEKFIVSVDGSLTGFKTYDPGTISVPKTDDNYIDIKRGYAGISVDNDHGVSKGSARFVYTFGHHNIYDGTDWVSDDFNAIFSVYQTLSVIPDNSITVGIDLSKFGGKGKNITKDYGTPSVYEYALYTSIQHTLFERLMLNGGLRYNRNELFGSEIVPQFGVSYRITGETSVRTSASKGYRSPTIAEMYMFAPTKTLQPEKMWNYEIGLMHNYSNTFSTELVGFVSEGDNLIRVAAFRPGGRENSGSFVHRGVELSGTYLPLTGNVRLHGNYSYIDAGNQTRSVPRHKMYCSAQYTYDIYTAIISAQHIEVMYGSDNSKDILPNYTLVKLKLYAQLLPAISVSLGVDNLLDETYYTMLGYPMPGTTVTAGVRAGL